MDFEETENEGEFRLTQDGECEKCGEYSESLFQIDEYLMCPSCEEDYQCPSAIAPGLFLDFFQNHSEQDIRVLDYLMDYPNKFFTVEELWQELNIGDPIEKEEVADSLMSLSSFGSNLGMVVLDGGAEEMDKDLEDQKHTLNQDEPVVKAIYEFEEVDREESKYDAGYKTRIIESGRTD